MSLVQEFNVDERPVRSMFAPPRCRQGNGLQTAVTLNCRMCMGHILSDKNIHLACFLHLINSDWPFTVRKLPAIADDSIPSTETDCYTGYLLSRVLVYYAIISLSLLRDPCLLY